MNTRTPRQVQEETRRALFEVLRLELPGVRQDVLRKVSSRAASVVHDHIEDLRQQLRDANTRSRKLDRKRVAQINKLLSCADLEEKTRVKAASTRAKVRRELHAEAQK